ncbi:MAG: glycosyltransferase [Syntrophaceae bacterium]|nr:glycosyltransferase [Syntrophaceae bacterium]
MRNSAIVVPCYNEFDRLPKDQFVRFCQSNTDIDFIFVNDGSTDKTHEAIAFVEERCGGKARGIALGKNCGKAEAVRQGFLKAIDEGFSYIGYWDADLSTPLESIRKLRTELEGKKYSIAMGSRVKLLGRSIERMAARHYLGRVFATFASLTLGLGVYDTQCGAKIFRNDHFLRPVFSLPFSVKWTFDVEILARYRVICEREGISIRDLAVEYPLETWTHVAGSKVTPADFFIGSFELFRICLYLRAPVFARVYAAQLRG